MKSADPATGAPTVVRPVAAIAVGLLASLTTAGCSPLGAPGGSPAGANAWLPPATPGLELGDEPYSAARARFRTELVRPGPANQLADPLTGPKGAAEFTYRSGDLTLRAFGTPVDPGGPRRPAVLFLHGGFAFGPGHWDLAAPFRAAGYVVLIPTLRGENGQPGACSMFFDEVGDVLAAGDLLRNRPDVDPERVFLAGHSVGGTLTLLASLASDRFRAAASFSAAPDMREWLRGRADRIPFPPDRAEEYRLRSSVAFADGFRCPVRLFYGEDEFWLHAGTLRAAGLAARAGLDVQAIELPGGHDSVTPSSVAACLRFFDGVP